MEETPLEILKGRVAALEEQAAATPTSAPLNPCPECQEDLTDKDIAAHQANHYGDKCPEGEANQGANKRWKQLEAMK